MITVLVAAGSAMGRAGLTAMLATSPLLEVVGQATGWNDLGSRIEDLRPDVILFDPGTHGDEISAFLAGGVAPPIVLIVDEAALSYLKAGARAVLPRSATASEITTAVQAVAAGLIAIHPDAMEPASVSVDNMLSGREVEVLRMLAEGLANKEIAYRLGLSEHTVKFHVAAIFGKLHASSRTEAVTLGIRQGLIML